MAETPFVICPAAVFGPEGAVDVGFLDEPAAEVYPVGFEGTPVDVVVGVDEGGDAAQGSEKRGETHGCAIEGLDRRSTV